MKTCQNKWCQTQFEVTDSDRAFYEKVSPSFNGKKYLIPEPTRCPDCRMQRRLSFRNERNLYKRKCSKTEKDIISIYSPNNPQVVYNREEWWSDSWDPLEYGRDYDFTGRFFEQYKALL
jgi:hypothetical protein